MRVIASARISSHRLRNSASGMAAREALSA
jgi:hypothetical protein